MVFQKEIKNRVKREDLLEIMNDLKSELVSILEGYQEIAERVEDPVVNIVRNNTPFVTNTNQVRRIANNLNYPDVRYLEPNYQHEGFIPKGGVIYTVPSKNVRSVRVSLETRKRNPNAKKSRYFKVETRKRNKNAKRSSTKKIQGTKF
jgi:hypothetical protein